MNLFSELKFDRISDLEDMLSLYLHDDSRDIPCGMSPLFSVARQTPKSFLNCGKILGISIGGSNTKVMLLSAKNERLTVHHFTSVKNPTASTHFYDFLDKILLSQPAVVQYLTHANPCYVGVSIPTPIINEVPIHATKLATIDGLLARTEADLSPALNFTSNLQNYFAIRGFSKPVLYYNMDGIVAHFGGVSLLDITPEERSILFVGGTGLALADDNIDRFLGMHALLPENYALYPPAETEALQYQYAIVGKGVFGVMQRAIALHSQQANSPLSDYDLHPYFSEIKHSKTVFKLYEYSINPTIQDAQVLALKSLLPSDAFSILLELATYIIQRAIGSIANCIIATLIKINQVTPGYSYHLVLEGSIAQNPLVKEQVSKILLSQETADVFLRYGQNIPILLDGVERVSVHAASPEIDLSDIDYTIIGACTSIIAKVYLDNNK